MLAEKRCWSSDEVIPDIVRLPARSMVEDRRHRGRRRGRRRGRHLENLGLRRQR